MTLNTPSLNQPQQAPLPPGSSGLPLIGETLPFVLSPVRFAEERQRKYGDIFCSNILGAPTVFLCSAEANQWIFAGEGKYLQNQWSAPTRRLLGARSLAMINGQEHLDRRRLLAPHFSYAAMRGFVPAIEALARAHFERWAARGGVTKVFPAIRELAFEIAVKLIFGEDPVDIPFLTRQFQVWTAGLFSPFPVALPFTPFGRALAAKQRLVDYLGALVSARMERAEQPPDVLGSLVSTRDEQGRALSREAIIDEVKLLLFAGHDTTVAATSNLMLLLANNPGVLQRGRAAVESLGEQPLTLDGLKAIPFLYQAIHEGMRVKPPVANAFRVMNEDVVFGGYRIPRGWSVVLAVAATHHRWPEPERFEPNRFGPDKKPEPGTFIPFGGGVRICLGQHFAMVEMSVMLALLLRHYTWELEPGQDLRYVMLPFPHPRSGIQVRFQRRTQG
jgi:cytochrome P450